MTNIEQLKLRIKSLLQQGKYHKAATLKLILQDELVRYGKDGK